MVRTLSVRTESSSSACFSNSALSHADCCSSRVLSVEMTWSPHKHHQTADPNIHRHTGSLYASLVEEGVQAYNGIPLCKIAICCSSGSRSVCASVSCVCRLAMVAFRETTYIHARIHEVNNMGAVALISCERTPCPRTP